MRIRKILALLLIMCMILPCIIVSATDKMTIVNDDETRTVLVSGNLPQPENMVLTITVWYPDADSTKIGTAPLNSLIAYGDETVTDENGDFSFNFKLKESAISGVYTVKVYTPGGVNLIDTFVYQDVKGAKKVFDVVVNSENDAAEIKAALDENILAVDVAAGKSYLAYEIPGKKSYVAQYLADNRPVGDDDAAKQEDLRNKVVEVVSALDEIEEATSCEREELKNKIEDENNPLWISTEALSAYNALTAENKDETIRLLSAEAPELIYPEDVSSALLSAVETVLEVDTTPAPSKPSNSGGGGGGGGGSLSRNEGNLSFDDSIPISTPDEKVLVAENSFKDLESVSWAKNAINTLASREIVNGREAGMFYPNELVKREEFVKLLVSAFELRITTQDALPFEDVDVHDWYYEPINIAWAQNIAKGVSETSFGVGAPLTRQDMAVLLANAIKAYGATLSTENTQLTYSDSDEIAGYAVDAVTKLTAYEVLGGRDDGRFDPYATASRAEAAAVIYRVMYKLNLL